MNVQTIDDAYRAAKQFMEMAENLIHVADGGSFYYLPRQTGALRRASMDLTRALADMRRPG
jgi:hypothetical protein